MIKLINLRNLIVHYVYLYEIYGELQAYESSVGPPTRIVFGGSLSDELFNRETEPESEPISGF